VSTQTFHDCAPTDDLFAQVVAECSQLRTACETAYMIADMSVRMGDTSFIALRDCLKHALAPATDVAP
jgi:hypothetical protein